MNIQLRNYQTSIAGVAMILSAVGFALTALTDNDPDTIINLNMLLAQILGGIGLIFSRDADKSSKKTGVEN